MPGGEALKVWRVAEGACAEPGQDGRRAARDQQPDKAEGHQCDRALPSVAELRRIRGEARLPGWRVLQLPWLNIVLGALDRLGHLGILGLLDHRAKGVGPFSKRGRDALCWVWEKSGGGGGLG